MNLEESRKQVKLIEDFAFRMVHENLERKDILAQLIKKGYEKKEAIVLLDLIQTEANKLISKRKKPKLMLIAAINGFLIGAGFIAFGGLYYFKYPGNELDAFHWVLEGAGLFFISLVTFGVLIYQRWKAKRESGLTDSWGYFNKY